MAKTDFLLRTTKYAPLTTKGSAISQVERDANWIALYNILVELSQSQNVAAYNASVTYDDTVNNYAMFNNQLWKYIDSNPAAGVTPVEGASWTAVYATNLSRKIKEYRASLTQLDTAPSASGEVSSIGSVTYEYISAGDYTITKVGFFDNASVIFSAVNGYVEVTSITSDVINFKTYNILGDLSDGILKNTGLSITIE